MESTNEISIPATLHPFRVPAGYFESLTASILSRIHEEELAIIAPLLYSIDKKMMYAAPAGYFEREVVIPATEKMPAKVVGLKGYRRVMQYVAAAMLAGVLISGAFIFTDSKNNFKPRKSVSVNKAEQLLPGDTSAADETVATDETVLPGTNAGNRIKRAASFAKRVESLSDDELQNYLEENAPPEPIQILEEDAEI